MDQPINILKGTVERITYTNQENGYTVARLRADGRFGLVTIVGMLAEVHPGARLKLEGHWKLHPRFGDQFEIERYIEEVPATVEGIRRYLGSGLIKGIGPVMAKRIAERFGPYTLDVIENNIERLVEVDGIGSKRAKLIAQAWEAQKQIKEIMLFLQSHQVSTRLAVKIYKSYGDQSISIVKANPYRMARDIYGIGFLTADTIAQNMGIQIDSPQRIAAGIEYTLNQLADQGHVFAPRDALIEAAVNILKVKPEQVDTEIDTLVKEERIKVETIGQPDLAALPISLVHPLDSPGQPESKIQNLKSKISQIPERGQNPTEAVYLNPFYYAEINVAHQARQLLTSTRSRLRAFKNVEWDKVFDWLAAREIGGVSLADRQREAVQMALTHKMSILTGGPGTGKTSTVKAVLQLVERKGKVAFLAAPTGRAAKRLSESTGREAKTIHRLLEVSPGEIFKFQRNQDNPLDCDLLILDECSMVDLVLMNNVLKAVHPSCHLLLVGDADQLPSVGAGNVLRDFIDSGVVPVTRLNVIFRQAAGSNIILNAHRINRGEMPIFPKLG